MVTERKKSSKKDVHSAMKEKYLHSKGARSLHDGDLEGAKVFFQKALKISEQSFTRYHCGLTYKKGNQLGAATSELSRAIEINPDVPEYYTERSSMFWLMGEPLNAEHDVQKACDLDENYRRIDVIKECLTTVRDFLSGPPLFEDPGKKRMKSGKIRAILNNLRTERDKRRALFENASCSLPCPPYCCHFSEETIVHGLYIGPWKLHAIREVLRGNGLPEDQYIGKISYGGEQYLKELIPPQFIVSEKGEKWIYYPLRQKKKLRRTVLKNLPKGNEYQTLVWINEKARACVFLQDGRCMIHDAGGEDGLPSCKEFLCLTGLVFVVLKSLGLVNDDDLAQRTTGELNWIAVESLIVLARDLFKHEGLVELERLKNEAFKGAIEADRAGNESAISRQVEKYESANIACEDLATMLKKNVHTSIAALIRR